MTTDDITEALKDKSLWESGFMTSDGRPVRILCDDLKAKNGESLAVAIMDAEREWVLEYFANGKYAKNRTSIGDLVRKPVKRKGWVILHQDHKGIVVPDRCFPFHKPQHFAPECIACIEIEFTEGEGLT